MNKDKIKNYSNKFLYLILAVLTILFGGATFYYYVEKLSYIDALYFSAATMTTVGYGDITPKTGLGRIFAMVQVTISIIIFLYSVYTLIYFIKSRNKPKLKKVYS